MDNCTRSTRIILRRFFRHGGNRGRIVGAACLDLLDPGHAQIGLKIEDHAVKNQHRHIARVEMLMRGPEGNMERAALVPVEPLTLDDAEPLALKDMHRFFTVTVLACMPANRNFRLEDIAPHRRKSEMIGDHQLDLDVMRRRDPRDILVARDEQRIVKLVLDPVRCFQPFIIKVLGHSSPLLSPVDKCSVRMLLCH